jgi:hypothetical protein
MVDKHDFAKNLEIPRLSLEKKLNELVEALKTRHPSIKVLKKKV